MRTTELKPVVHQSIKNQRLACGADMATEPYTPYCAAVTCPKCLEWQEKLVAAVFAPLPEYD